MNSTAQRQPKGYTFYRGPSLLDGKPIVAIALMGSGNRKTGNMVQTYILADNGIRPSANVASGDDVSVCGDCKHRPVNGGSCYVVVSQGPTVVYKQHEAGNYPDIAIGMLSTMVTSRMVRIGTYGDPAAVPAHIWSELVSLAKGHTGYTHQWNNPALDYWQLDTLKGIVMASADTPAERDDAQRLGWRTFTVRLESDSLGHREVQCPASEEAGKKLTCEQCGACSGTGDNRKSHIAIIAHGVQFKVQRYIALRLA